MSKSRNSSIGRYTWASTRQSNLFDLRKNKFRVSHYLVLSAQKKRKESSINQAVIVDTLVAMEVWRDQSGEDESVTDF